ncbi:MAG: amino acid adenylation domain-containing protein, partial [Niallia nealsonii]|nr:amino acid adenylation domain-containing protein [Niallia nealsonii]
KAELTFQEFLADVKQRVLGAYEHGDFPFEELVEHLQLPRDLSRSPLLDTLFTLQNIEEKNLFFSEVKVADYEVSWTTSKSDLNWDITEDNVLTISLEYSTGLYQEETICRMANHFQEILIQITRKSNLCIKDIELVSEKEKHQLLVEFNNTEAEYPENQTIHEIFEAQVIKTPNAIAVEYEEEKVTYEELNRRANQLARVLRKRGVEKDSFVGLLVERSVEMIVGILGILKSGGAYVPIDPEYPQERIEYILQDSKIQVLVTQKHLNGNVQYFDGTSIFIDEKQLFAEESTNLIKVNTSHDLAYLIYTSGSTGKPKGVMIEHEGVCNLSQTMGEFGVYKDSRVLQFASIGFDASVWEIIPSLLRGATICIPSSELTKEPSKLEEWLGAKSITLATLTPSILNALNPDNLTNIKQVVTAGEVCSIKIARSWAENRDFINAYGPTEATVCASSCFVDPKLDFITIGNPIINKKVYILDANLKLQPIGVPGELCISGIGIARGYLNRPELTKEKFLTNPFEPGKRLYRTG